MSPRALVAAAALAVVLTGCDSGGDPELRLPGSEGIPAKPEQVVAAVNGRPITGAMVELYAEARSQQHPTGQPPQRDALVQELINMELLAQEGERAGLLDDAELASALYLQRANLLAAAMIERTGAGGPSEAQVKARYDERYPDGEITEYRTRQILVPERKTAEDLIARLDAGADFAELAREHSRGPAAARGGALDWFRAADVLPEVAAAVAALKPGTYTAAPAQTTYGWHVLLLEDVRQVSAPALQETAPQIRAALVTEALEHHLEELRAKAEVEVK